MEVGARCDAASGCICPCAHLGIALNFPHRSLSVAKKTSMDHACPPRSGPASSTTCSGAFLSHMTARTEHTPQAMHPDWRQSYKYDHWSMAAHLRMVDPRLLYHPGLAHAHGPADSHGCGRNLGLDHTRGLGCCQRQLQEGTHLLVA